MMVISAATDSVWEAVIAWQNRPLERSYPGVYFDALRVKIRDEGRARNKAVYLAMHRRRRDQGRAGHWIEQNEGAKFWLQDMNELRNGGVEDILIAVVDGLKGSPEPMTTVHVGQRANLDRAFKLLLPLLFAAGSSARQGLANSKPSNRPKAWRSPPSGSRSSTPAPGERNIR